jgi:hypothetical protein
LCGRAEDGAAVVRMIAAAEVSLTQGDAVIKINT